MVSTEDLSQLLALLYAAPLRPEMWQAFFDRLSQVTKTASGYLLVADESMYPEVLAGGGFHYNPESLERYNAGYGRFDPFREPFLRDARVGIIEGEELVSHNTLVNTEFYNDLLSSYDMDSMTLMSCIFTPEMVAFMPLWRRAREGPMDTDCLALLRMILPHAHNAIRIRTALHAAALQSKFAETTLDTLSSAAFLVAANGRVQHMNKQASALVQTSASLRLDSAVLIANDPAENARLEALISAAASKGGRGAEAPGGAMNLSCRSQNPGEERPLHVTVLPTPLEQTGIGMESSAVVLVTDPNASPRSRASTLRMLYHLTPIECRIADLLLEGREVREMACRLSITLETARFHLKRILAKTGTHRQTELMRLMLTLPGV